MNSFLVSLGGISAGMIIFQSALNAPTIFKAFSENEAGPFLRLIFPKLFSCVFFVSVLDFCFLYFLLQFFFKLLFFCLQYLWQFVIQLCLQQIERATLVMTAHLKGSTQSALF